MGSFILKHENIELYDSKYTYRGDIYYNGRTKVTFYDSDVEKLITLDKKSLSGLPE